MKANIIVLALLLISTISKAQQVVSTSGGSMDVFYSMPNGEIKSESNINWDLAFEIKGFSGSVLINGQKGNAVYAAPFAIADWSKFDSTGYKSWTSPINSLESWSMGAFSQNPSDQFDLGWGKYDISTHAVVGDSIFLVELSDGSLKKMYIKDLTAGTYTFVYADVDGQNEATQTIKTTDYANQNFAYFNLSTEMVLTREPMSSAWDILFTKYIQPISAGGGQFLNYAVGGIKINKGIEVAQRNGMAVTSNDTSTLNWNQNITEIGSDWKTFDGSKYVFAQNQVYFLRLANGDVWKIYFTNYEGGSLGKYYFNQELISGTSGIASKFISGIVVYPNPTTASNIHVKVEANVQITAATLTDLSGRTISADYQNGKITVPQSLTPGLYSLKLNTNQGSLIKRIILQ